MPISQKTQIWHLSYRLRTSSLSSSVSQHLWCEFKFSIFLPLPLGQQQIFLLHYIFVPTHFWSILTLLCNWSWTFCSNLVISSTLAVAVLSSVLASLNQEDREKILVQASENTETWLPLWTDRLIIRIGSASSSLVTVRWEDWYHPVWTFNTKLAPAAS